MLKIIGMLFYPSSCNFLFLVSEYCPRQTVLEYSSSTLFILVFIEPKFHAYKKEKVAL
jgi:hypothetical protein